MSISVTVSGEDSTSIILTQPQTELISISGDQFINVTAFSGDSATVIVSSGDPISVTGNYSNFVTGQVVRPPEISDFLTENQINTKIITATGDYNTLATNTFYLDSNPSGFITGVDLSSYIQNSETGSFYATSNPSGFITGIDLSSYTTEDFVTGISGLLQSQISSNYSDITGIINTTGSFVLKSETGSFISESETGQFYSTSNPSGFITSVDLSALETATGNLDTRVSSNSSDIINVSGLITSNDEDISALQTATGLLVQKSETGNFVTNSETGVLYLASNPSGFITGVDLSSYVQDSETGAFYASSNPSGFITGVDLSSYVQNSETGLFLVSGEDAVVNNLTTSGNVGIGIDNPSAKLEVLGSATSTIGVINTTNVNFIHGTDTPTINARFPTNNALTFGSMSMGKYGTSNNGVGLRFQQVEGTDRLIFRGSSSPGAMVWSQPEANAQLLIDIPNRAFRFTDTVFTPMRASVDLGGNTSSTRWDNLYANNGYFNNGLNVNSLFVVDSSGDVGIGTTSPTEKLEVNGDLMLQQNGVIKNKNNTTQFKFGVNDLYLDSGHLRAGYSVGIRGNRGSTKGMEQGSTRNSDLGLYCASIEAISIRNDGNVDANYNFTINQDLSVSGDSSFSNRPTVNGTGVLLSGEGGGGTVANVVHTTGDQTISGTKSFGKISLSENSFVTETGSFTMSSTHRGATVLLQNSAPMTVTIPAQVSGHTTTFIAETSNSVVFATGAGISGFNSFNSANQIAGIYGQAQIIFKSPEYAFLGGNVV